MSLDSAENRTGARQGLSPMEIAGHPLFTVREKLDLLAELRAGLDDSAAMADGLGFTAAEVDAAIAAVRQQVVDGLEAGIMPAGED